MNLIVPWKNLRKKIQFFLKYSFLTVTKKKLKQVFENIEMHQNKNQTTFKMSKPNCKVCRDAGKSEQECSSHWVRDKAGRVTCPTLLSQKCHNCGKSGHTLKYCKLTVAPPKPTTEKKEPKKEVQVKNIYTLLDDEQPEPVATPKKTSYVDILVKEAPTPQIGKIVNLKDLKKSTINLVPVKLKHSWASEVSSESTEEDEQRVEPEFNDSDSESEQVISRPMPISYKLQTASF